MLISSTLKNWYLQNKRNLPWRNTSNPYHIWVSEIILQQTKVAQGLPYFERFIVEFPNITALANASERNILKIWQGLGYYSRARNMQTGAKYILENYNGNIPNRFEDLLKVKGIGEYTASAIASIAFNLPYPVVDGNVCRVISRLFGFFEPINSTSGFKIIKQKAFELIDKDEPAVFNQSIMEFGALQCVPRNPDCSHCPLKLACYAFKHTQINNLPFKIKASKATERFFNYLAIECNGSFYLHKRSSGDIWNGLYEFPLIETDKLTSVTDIMVTDDWAALIGRTNSVQIGNPVLFTHQLTHRKIVANFIPVKVNSLADIIIEKFIQVDRKLIHEYPVSRLIHKFLEKVEI